jgi:hypothetical protein
MITYYRHDEIIFIKEGINKQEGNTNSIEQNDELIEMLTRILSSTAVLNHLPPNTIKEAENLIKKRQSSLLNIVSYP